MDIKKCDRCGKIYEPYTEYYDPQNRYAKLNEEEVEQCNDIVAVEGVQLGRSHYGCKRLDLCRECLHKLMIFLSDKDTEPIVAHYERCQADPFI